MNAWEAKARVFLVTVMQGLRLVAAGHVVPLGFASKLLPALGLRQLQVESHRQVILFVRHLDRNDLGRHR